MSECVKARGISLGEAVMRSISNLPDVKPKPNPQISVLPTIHETDESSGFVMCYVIVEELPSIGVLRSVGVDSRPGSFSSADSENIKSKLNITSSKCCCSNIVKCLHCAARESPYAYLFK